jgi:hypothetical protein
MDKKKFAAAIAAVSAYIKTQEEASAYYIPEGPGSVPALAAQTQQVVQQNNIWGISGRQNHMQANAMMQLRMFK